MFYASDRSFSPTYSSLDTTFIYTDSTRLLAVPLRVDVADPWPLESDEEEWEEDEEEGGEAKESESSAEAAAVEAEAEVADDGLTGVWEGSLSSAELPDGADESQARPNPCRDGSVKGVRKCPSVPRASRGSSTPAPAS